MEFFTPEIRRKYDKPGVYAHSSGVMACEIVTYLHACGDVAMLDPGISSTPHQAAVSYVYRVFSRVDGLSVDARRSQADSSFGRVFSGNLDEALAYFGVTGGLTFSSVQPAPVW